MSYLTTNVCLFFGIITIATYIPPITFNQSINTTNYVDPVITINHTQYHTTSSVSTNHSKNNSESDIHASGSSTFEVIGIIVGIWFGLVFIWILMFLYFKYKSKQRQKNERNKKIIDIPHNHTQNEPPIQRIAMTNISNKISDEISNEISNEASSNGTSNYNININRTCNKLNKNKNTMRAAPVGYLWAFGMPASTTSVEMENLYPHKHDGKDTPVSFDDVKYADIEETEEKCEFVGVDCFMYYDKQKIKISDNNDIITNIFGTDTTCYGSLSIPCDSKGKHEWKFKILKHRENTERDIRIGIDESLHKWKHTNFCAQKDTINYGYGSTGTKGDVTGTMEYDATYTADDEITMVLDMSRKQLSFSKNTGKLKRAFTVNNSDNGYSMAVCIQGVLDSVTLISYHYDGDAQIDDDQDDEPVPVYFE